MRILTLHNSYQHPGGEDAVFAAERDLLISRGHNVRSCVVSNHDIVTLHNKISTFLNSDYNPKKARWIEELIYDVRPEVIHIHNFFPLLTPAVHQAAAEAGCAIVQTLHNYRLICPSALLFRNDKICEKCVGHSTIWGVVHKCYKQSYLGSYAVSRMIKASSRRNIWERSVHRFIVLTEFARTKFIEGGLPARKMVVRPNFTHMPKKFNDTERKGALFVGRLSREKGVHVLVEAWRRIAGTELRIIGDGPEFAILKESASSNIKFMGALSKAQVQQEMFRAQALVVPSLWYEACPMTIIEAFSCGLPVICSNIGSLAELVVPEQMGYHFQVGNASDLTSTIRHAFSQPQHLVNLGRQAHAAYLQRYSPERHVVALEEIYAEAIAESTTLGS